MTKQRGALVIAGGSRGLSRGLAAEGRKQGYTIALIARNKADLKEASEKLLAEYPGDGAVSFHVADLTNDKQVKKAVDEIEKRHKRIEVLINNAATWTGGKTVEQLSRADVQRSLDLNFFSAFNATKAVLAMRSKKKWTELAIINIGATSSLQGWDGVFAFCVGKSALRVLSQSLARELQPNGVHVAHVIIDGLIDNTRTRHINPKLAANRFMKMESIAGTVVNLALQEKSAWTFEMDLRPYNENW